MNKCMGIFFLLLISCLNVRSDVFAKSHTFSGGPEGGTYQYYANAIAELSEKAGTDMRAVPSGGAIVNIRLVDSGKSDFGVAYSGDVFKAKKGMLARDRKKYENVLAMGYFYSAAGQLVVRANAGILSVEQLTGKRLGVGNFGSGAAASCEVFLKELGVWHKAQKKFLGYADAAKAFKKGELDAFWVFSGFPNASVTQAANENSIALVSIYDDIEKSGLLEKYPYFSKQVIPADTYKGVSSETITLRDAALWIVHSRVPAELVYKLLGLVYSYEGIDHMIKAHKSAKDMSVQKGISGIVTPLHPGAEKFWKEKGVIK